MSNRIEHVDADTFAALATEALTNLDPQADLEAMMVSFNLIRVANRLQHDLEASVHRPAGVSWAAFRVLFAVAVVGPIAPSQLAHLSSVSAASISGVLNTLERDGLITRRRAAEDGRSVLVWLTARGRRATDDLLERNHARESAWAQALTARERATLTRLLQKLLAHHPAPAAADGEPAAVKFTGALRSPEGSLRST